MDPGYWLQFWWLFPVALMICVTVCTLGVSGAVLGGYLANRVPGSWLLLAIGMALVVFASLLLRETVEPGHAQAGVEDGRHKNDGLRLREHRDRQGRVYRYVLRNDAVRAGAATLGGLFQGLVGGSEVSEGGVCCR